MSSVFNWRDQPSEVGKAVQPSTKARENPRNNPSNGVYRRPNLAPKRMHFYAEATSMDEARESEITQIGVEVEHHFALAQLAATDELKAIHRDEARRLAARVKALVASRPEAYVAYLEQQRGI